MSPSSVFSYWDSPMSTGCWSLCRFCLEHMMKYMPQLMALRQMNPIQIEYPLIYRGWSEARNEYVAAEVS
jgi:hypothetical protein